MTKSTITREQLEEWVTQFDEDGGCDATDRQLEALIRQSLTAMDSESVGNEFIPKNLDKALGVVGMALPESKEEFNFQIERWIQRLIDRVIRYADEFKEQPAPVVPQDVLEALQKVARIRLDMNDFDGDRRGIADCLGDAEEALIEVVNRRAAMLQELQKSAGVTNNCRSNENMQDMQAGNSPVIPGAEQRIADAVELLKKAAPAMLADNIGPDGPLVGRLKSQVVPGCWCRTCRPVVWNDMRFVVCPDCGNKRCPRANDHRNACTGSNEPGQEGSAYQAAQQGPKP